MTVLENVRAALQRNLGTSFHFWKPEKSLEPLHQRAEELLAAVDLARFAGELTVNLPYGRKRALELATTMALEPELMLLDEPTQGMGHEDVHRVTELIKKISAGRTILMVEHNMNVVASIADRITVLAARRHHRGRAVRGGLGQPAGDRGLHGHRRYRLARSALKMAPTLLSACPARPGYCAQACQGRPVGGLNDQGAPAHRRPERLVRRIAHPARRRPRGERGRSGDAAGPQRRRPHHHPARHRRPDRHAQGIDPDQRRGSRSSCRRTRSPGWASVTARKNGAFSPACRPRKT